MARSQAHHETRQSRLRRFIRRRRKPLSEAFAAQSADRVFEPSDEGGAIFGRWTIDNAGLPAYEYTLDQYADPRAKYANSERQRRQGQVQARS